MEITETENDEFNVDVPYEVIEGFEGFEKVENDVVQSAIISMQKDVKMKDFTDNEKMENSDTEVEDNNVLEVNQIRNMNKKDMNKYKYKNRQRKLSPTSDYNLPAHQSYETKIPLHQPKIPPHQSYATKMPQYTISGKSFKRSTRRKMGKISKASLMHIARRAGVQRISKSIYPIYRHATRAFLRNALKAAVTYTDHAKRKTVTVKDIKLGLAHVGYPLYTTMDKNCYFQ